MLCPTPRALALERCILRVLGAVPVPNALNRLVVRNREDLEGEGVALRFEALQWSLEFDLPLYCSHRLLFLAMDFAPLLWRCRLQFQVNPTY